MSAEVKAPCGDLGKGGDYSIEMNYGIRIYNGEPLNEIVPQVGQESATLKGGQRTNFHGEVPILDNDKTTIGVAEVTRIVSARPQFMPIDEIKKCGFETIELAVKYAQEQHGEEFQRDGVLTVYHFKVVSLNS